MKKFYDMHMHVFDLSHPNLLAFLRREGLLDAQNIITLFMNYAKKKGKSTFFLKIILKLFRKKITKEVDGFINENLPKLTNYLAIMENPIEYQLLLVEHFLKNKEPIVDQNGRINVGDEHYEKMILCPLLMDFGVKNIETDEAFYNRTPKKPIAKQVEDVLNAIRIYYNYSLYEDEAGKLKIEKQENRPDTFFEIYPFMGLNTQNYSYEELEDLFEKYFSTYENDKSAEQRYSNLKRMLGKFDGNIDQEKLLYFFAGIKVYPPLGFNPWPESENEELKKVKFLYQKAIEKSIPIVTHCSDGGYNAVGTKETAQELTNPANGWSKVLNQPEFSKLKLCFAHFGSQDKNKKEWRNQIIELMQRYDNVYADISCNDGSKAYYAEIDKLIENPQSKVAQRIIFGSDFSINLLSSTSELSYNHYLQKFITKSKSKSKSILFTSNPERFLFAQ